MQLTLQEKSKQAREMSARMGVQGEAMEEKERELKKMKDGHEAMMRGLKERKQGIEETIKGLREQAQ